MLYVEVVFDICYDWLFFSVECNFFVVHQRSCIVEVMSKEEMFFKKYCSRSATAIMSKWLS